MNTCETCKYWSAGDYAFFSPARNSVRECTYAEMFNDSCVWNEAGENVLKSDRKAFVQSGSLLSAWLLTKADFGCNQWEAK